MAFLLPNLADVPAAEVAAATRQLFPVVRAVASVDTSANIGGSVDHYLGDALFAELILSRIPTEELLRTCGVSRAWCKLVVLHADPRLLALELLRARCCLLRDRWPEDAADIDRVEAEFHARALSGRSEWPLMDDARTIHLAATIGQLRPWPAISTIRMWGFSRGSKRVCSDVVLAMTIFNTTPAGLTKYPALSAARFARRIRVAHPSSSQSQFWDIVSAATCFNAGYEVCTSWSGGVLVIRDGTRQGGTLQVSPLSLEAVGYVCRCPEEALRFVRHVIYTGFGRAAKDVARQGALVEQTRISMCGPNPMFVDTLRFSPGFLLAAASGTEQPGKPSRQNLRSVFPVPFENPAEMLQYHVCASICPTYLLHDFLQHAAALSQDQLVRSARLMSAVIGPAYQASYRPNLERFHADLVSVLRHRTPEQGAAFATALFGNALHVLLDVYCEEFDAGARSVSAGVRHRLSELVFLTGACKSLVGGIAMRESWQRTLRFGADVVRYAMRREEYESALLLWRLTFKPTAIAKELHDRALFVGAYRMCTCLLQECSVLRLGGACVAPPLTDTDADNRACLLKSRPDLYSSTSSPQKRKRRR